MKVLRILAISLVAPALFYACKDNASIRLRYQAEKLYYEADKAAHAADFRGDFGNSAVARNVRDQFGRVTDLCFDALDKVPVSSSEHRQLAVIAYAGTNRLTQLFLDAHKYDTCIVLLKRLLAVTDLGIGEQQVTTYNYGRALQLEGKWDSAQLVFRSALEKYAPPLDERGSVQFLLLNLPLRIHRALVDAGDSTGAKVWFDYAERYYQKWGRADGPPTELSMTSIGNIARLYEDAGMWDRSAQMLMTMKDPTGQTASAPKLRLADIYVEHLDRPDEAIKIYDELYGILKGSDTMARPGLLLKKSLAYVAKKDYAKARELLTEISAQWPGFYAQNSAAQFNKAKCFEMEKNWDRAEAEYRFLIENYPKSWDALTALLYLAKKTEDEGRAIESKQWYDRANKTFDDLAAKGAGTPDEAVALYFKADLHRQRGEWAEAVTTLQQVFERFPQTGPGQRAGIMAIQVCRDKLRDNRKADSLALVYQQTLLNAQTDSVSR